MLASSQAQTRFLWAPSPHPLPTCVSSETRRSHRRYCWCITGIPVVPGVTKKLELRDTTSAITVPNDLTVNITQTCSLLCNLPLAGVIQSINIKWWRGHIPFRCVIKGRWLGLVQIVREDQRHHESDIWLVSPLQCVLVFYHLIFT